jgi:hypothetical protein
MRNRIFAVGIGLVVSAVALVSTGTSVGGAASSTPPVVKQVVLTVTSSGSTVLATKGELVVVKLAGHHLRWSVAQAEQTTPVLALVSEGTTTTGASTTVFRVVNYGTAGLSATGTPVCASAVGCPQFVLLWHATVVVPVVDPPPTPVG